MLALWSPLLLGLGFLGTGCRQEPNGDGSPDDTGTGPTESLPPPDACDEHAGEVLCLDGAAVTCDSDGDIGTTLDCASDPASTCVDGTGCATCTPTITVPLSDPAIVLDRGIFLPLDGAPAFDPIEHWMLARPVRLAMDPALVDGGLVVETTDPLLVVLDAEGAVLPLPAILPLDTTALQLWSATPGEAELVVRYEEPLATCSEVEARLPVTVAQDPGLSGRPLPSFPWFETVRAFNDTEPLYAALDPFRFFDRQGLEADLHVVAPRTGAEWSLDPTLVDVSGAVETVTISDTLAANTWEIWSTPAAEAPGTDYQIVLDFGRDGVLDAGDLVTGIADDPVLVASDLSAAGPHDVITRQYSGGSWLGQRIYFPSDIDKLGAVPLVVVSHGNGHDYTWYDYLGEHLASYGVVVMSHQNNTGPGIETASETTLTNTDYLLSNLDTLVEGALLGHVDSHRILWIGHSRGGEGVVRAYDRIFDGEWVPVMYTLDDIALVASIAPTVFNSVLETDPHEVTYHLIAGTADGDVSGGPDSDVVQFFRISQQARGEVSTLYVHGADHNDFNCCGSNDSAWWGASPDLVIGREETQILARSYFLVLVERYLFGREPFGEFLTRRYEGFHPSGIDPSVVASNSFENAEALGDQVVDDFQSNGAPALASAGGEVTYDVTNLVEGRLDDANSGLAWNGTDPMNGMTQADQPDDLEAGVVFDWDVEGSFYEVAIPKDERDLRAHAMISFRAAQGTRHPYTVSLDQPLSFTVTLVDGSGGTSSIDFGLYGAVPEMYLRDGLGAGEGWANEFNTIRIPLTAFEADGALLDRSDIVAIRLEVGKDWGSALGRIGLDDVEVTLQ